MKVKCLGHTEDGYWNGTTVGGDAASSLSIKLYSLLVMSLSELPKQPVAGAGKWRRPGLGGLVGRKGARPVRWRPLRTPKLLKILACRGDRTVSTEKCTDRPKQDGYVESKTAVVYIP